MAQSKLLVVELCPPISMAYSESLEEAPREIMICPFPPSESKYGLLIPATEYNELVKRIEYVIGGYGSRLLFMDAKRWVCSVDTSQAGLKYYMRHFPIPSDWDSQQRELIMAVTCNGGFLFVRDNEVAVISGGLEFEERVEVDGVDAAEASC